MKKIARELLKIADSLSEREFKKIEKSLDKLEKELPEKDGSWEKAPVNGVKREMDELMESIKRLKNQYSLVVASGNKSGNKIKIAEELLKIAKELAVSEYKVTVETMVSSYSDDTPDTLEEEVFDNDKDAKKFVKQMMQKYKLKKHAGHIVNYKDGVELFTNF